MRNIFQIPLTVAAVAVYIAWAGSAPAVMSGPCSGCHTMHNSQNNLPMRYGTNAGREEPLPQLLRGDCYGCHAQGETYALFNLGVDVIPQVYHNDTSKGAGLDSDLAGGNFAYIDGTKSSPSGASGNKGHNILDLVGADGVLTAPPGGFKSGAMGAHPEDSFAANELICAGTRGCHGNRNSGLAGYEGISGAHHNNANGKVTQGDTDKEPGHGYRFLLGVNGYEDSDWQYTKSESDHNEYFAVDAPEELSCSALGCHSGANGGVRPPRGTMAEYCGTCHGNFHSISVGLGDDTPGNGAGVGPGGAAPWLRHPSDLSIDNSADFGDYTVYRTDTPVARLAVVDPSNTVTGDDAVFCLSCHVAHASPYPDMLKWDYATMDAGNAGAAAGSGCFACHSSKE